MNNLNPVRIHIIDHSMSRLLSPEYLPDLRELLSYTESNYYYGEMAFRKKSEIGRTGLFLTGYVDLIKKHFPVRIVRDDSCKGISVKNNIEGFSGGDFKFFRDQVDVFEKIKNTRRGFIKYPTGSGKTVIAAGVIYMYDPEMCLFIVHTKDLLVQTIENFQNYFGKKMIGCIGSGKYKPGRITVGTIQSLGNRFSEKESQKVDMIIVDEGHHLHSSSYRKFINTLTNCSVRYALTGTMHKKNKAAILIREGLIGPAIAEITSSTLIDRGRLAKPKIYFCSYKDLPVDEFDPEEYKSDDYRAIYQLGIVQNRERNKTIAKVSKECVMRGEKILIIVKHVRHGKYLEALGAGVLVQGSTKIEERTFVKKLFGSTSTGFSVIATPVWDEGTDIPSVNAIIPAGAGKSEIKVIQWIGRGLRVTESKKTVDVYDFIDSVHPILLRHSKSRAALFKREGWPIQVVDMVE